MQPQSARSDLAPEQEPKNLPSCKRQWREDRSFLRKSSQREPYCRSQSTIFKISSKAPKYKSSRREIDLRQRALGEKHRIQRCTNSRRNRHLCISHALG